MDRDQARRVGRFTVTREMIDDNLEQAVYAEVTPIEVKHDALTGAFEVWAWSQHFDMLETRHAPLRMAPYYRVEFVRKEDSEGGLPSFGVRFVREDEDIPPPASVQVSLARALMRMIRDLPVYFRREDLERIIRDYPWGEAALYENRALGIDPIEVNRQDPCDAFEQAAGSGKEGDPAAGQSGDIFGSAIRKAIDVGRF
jgi:hypothetical protein